MWFGKLPSCSSPSWTNGSRRRPPPGRARPNGAANRRPPRSAPWALGETNGWTIHQSPGKLFGNRWQQNHYRNFHLKQLRIIHEAEVRWNIWWSIVVLKLLGIIPVRENSEVVMIYPESIEDVLIFSASTWFGHFPAERWDNASNALKKNICTMVTLRYLSKNWI